MPIVCGVRFRGAGKIYHFDPGQLPVEAEDYVIVSTARGNELGQVSEAPHEVNVSQVVGELKPVVRKATSIDLVHAEQYRQREAEAVGQCQTQIGQYGLEMKVVSAEYNYDGSRLTFFFTADDRVDFRSLVRDLARTFKTRIELRQIGVRDEAKLVGGLGPCGRPLCCATWLTQFSPVSIRMAKQQNLPLSPMEISGLCGRLLCCLTYENDYYHEIRGRFPKVGRTVDTPYGTAKVIKVSVLRETVTLLLEDGSTAEMTADQLSGAEPLASREPSVEDAKLTNTLQRTVAQADRGNSRSSERGAGRNVGPDRPPRSGGRTQDQPGGSAPARNASRDASRSDGPRDARRDGGSQPRSAGTPESPQPRSGDGSDANSGTRRPRGGRSGRRRRGPRTSNPLGSGESNSSS